MTATSQNGFPALGSGSTLLHKWVLPDVDRTFTTRGGSTGFLLMHLALWYHERVDPLDGGVWDEWGYAYRPVRGYETTLSNHSSGTAIDVDATQWPLGTVHMPADKVSQIRRRLVMYRGTIRWGGDYAGRKDQMHFEIDASMARCEEQAKRLLDTPRGRRIIELQPGQRDVIYS